MPRTVKKRLTVAEINKKKPDPTRTLKLFDGRGLYLEIQPSGGKLWRLKYRFAGIEKRLSLGAYVRARSTDVEVNLEQARCEAETARQRLRSGVDPSQERKAEKLRKVRESENTFEAIGREWYQTISGSWAPDHAKRVLRLLERDIFPQIGERPISEIDSPEVLAVLRRIEARGVNMTVHRGRTYCRMIFAFAIASGRCKHNPATELRGALAPLQKSHFASVTEPKELAPILRSLDGYDGTPTVRCALRLAPLVVVRPGELRKAEWKDIDLDNAEWRYVASKTHPDHIVPLSKQAVQILGELKPLTGSGTFVFPGARSGKRPMSDNAILAAMRRMEIPADTMTGHGFRASFRTIGDEVLGFRVELMEHQLAHMVKDPNGRAYNRTSFLPERKQMMQRWADYLDRLKAGEESNLIVGNFGKTA